MSFNRNKIDNHNYFDSVIGAIEDIVISPEFQETVDEFMNAHYEVFERKEENKLCYTHVFQEYANLLEGFIEKELNRRIKGFDINKLAAEIRTKNIKPLDGEIYELVLSLTDFLVFKDLILDYKDSKLGQYQNLSFLNVKTLK